MNCVCNRAKAAAQGKKDVQVCLDAKKLKILFLKKHTLASFFLSSVEKESKYVNLFVTMAVKWRKMVVLHCCHIRPNSTIFGAK